MGYRRGLSLTTWMAAGLGLLLPGLAGCAMKNSFLDPTTVGQFPAEYKERGIRRILTPRDTPPGPPNASEPTPEDLVPAFLDYRLAPGDVVGLVIPDLTVPGTPEEMLLEVSPTGMLRVPQLGTLKVTGLTEQELEEELKARFRESGLLPDADIRVVVQAKRQRVFTIRGSVGRAGTYPIPEPDTRLLDVLGMVADVGATVQKLYIIRRGTAAVSAESVPPVEPRAAPGDLIVPPPADEEPPPGGVRALPGQFAQEPPATRSQEREVQRADLEAVLAPGQTAPATQETGAAPERPFAPIIFDSKTGEVVERAPESVPGAARPPGPGAPPPRAQAPFDWEAVPEVELEQRVIEIDVRALLAGDPRYNVVVRDKDVINVPVDAGVYYLMGEVNRPGVYAFNGRDITIKQALASSGGFTPLAWPARCEIIRHEPGTDKQLTLSVNLDEIFAGLADDVFLRDDDIVNVGTHFVSPFLFVIRNSFRFTYGFGFVYDRNFADKDSYYPKQNPEWRVQQRGEGLLF